ncbi:MAG: type II secretion system GspH family protein [Planctomycetes bacterium]|nr:type II secretion system GspH family protein [Planctomycetota bacterium]
MSREPENFSARCTCSTRQSERWGGAERAEHHGPGTYADRAPLASASRIAGFTLLELLVVVAILATIAGGVIATLGGVEEEAGRDLTRHQLAELKRAVLRFRADTGHLPKQGPFDLAQGQGGPAGGSGVAGLRDGETATWFYSPANLDQLLREPVRADGTPVLPPWVPDRRRGWRGPYLSRGGDWRVAVGAGPSLADGATPLWVPGLADALPRPPLVEGTAFPAFEWRFDVRAIERHGRPLLYVFDPTAPQDAHLRSAWLDGRFGTDDDVRVDLLR